MKSQAVSAFFPFQILASREARHLLGRDAGRAAVMALKAILQHRKSLEVAHQQIRYRGHDLAFSSRITPQGEIVLDLEIGDPRLAGRLVLEEELRRSVRKVRGIA